MSKKQNKPRCPRCKSAPCTYREVAITAYRFDLHDDRFNEAPWLFGNVVYEQHGFDVDGVKIETELDEPDHTGQIIATCGQCGHDWTLRNFHAIDELIALHGHHRATPPGEE